RSTRTGDRSMSAMAASPKPPATRKEAAVSFEGAAVRLGGRTIWSDVSLTVAEADFVAVLGPNGAGKSTLIKAILGLLPLAAGTGSVLGRRPGAAKGRVGYLPQRPGFDPGTRIRGVALVLPNQAAVAALVRRICEEERVAVLLVAHDLNPIIGYLDRVIYLAGGGAVEGPPEDVITSETLSRLYGAPIEVLHASDGRLVV